MPLSGDPVPALPDPGMASSFDDLVERLRLLKVWAGDPSYETIKNRVNAAWTADGRPPGELTRRSTVAYCFRPGRRRLDTDLVLAVVQALHPDTGYVTAWRQALQVVGGHVEAVSQVRVQDSLPQDLDGFTGRTGELDRLRRAARGGEAVVISAIEGMAGVGKTHLAVHAGHLLHRQQPFERVLFVNLRGFDPAQPPADPGAVLDGFLRLLGMPGQQIPHTLDARTAAYRSRLTGTRALVVLDNAATTTQIRPLLPNAPGCLTLVTSRRHLTGLHPATHLAVDVFTPDEALTFLTHAVPGTPTGPDPHAAARTARRCGYLPLALSLITGHIRNTAGWTLTDHADRLDERHDQRRLDTAVELALHQSYQHLPDDQRRLLRLLALHPGQDFDAYAAAALAGTDLDTVRIHLRHLHSDHLLQQVTAGRYTLHDLVRAFATTRAHDEDRPAERRTVLTRMFDYYLATTAAAMDTLRPAEAHLRPRVPRAGTPAPDLTDPDTARAWLDSELSTLVAVAANTAVRGWPRHTTRLSRILFRYLDGGHFTDAMTVHHHARQAAYRGGDPIELGHVLANLAVTHRRFGNAVPALEYLQQALALFRQAGDPAGQARTLYSLGNAELQSGRHGPAGDLHTQALARFRQAGDRAGEAHTLNSLGNAELRCGRHGPAGDHFTRALALFRQAGDRDGEAHSLNFLGEAEMGSGRYGPAGDHLRQALALFRQAGNRTSEATVLDVLGTLQTRRGRPAEAVEHHRQALAVFRDTGFRHGEAWALNGLGEAAHTAGRPADALTHHTEAHTIAVDSCMPDQQARASAGIGHAHRALGDVALALEGYRRASALYSDLGMPEADQIDTHLRALEAQAATRAS
jgi:tetratricopeptide (TPR) repeat protein